jgi:hypothetical protein
VCFADLADIRGVNEKLHDILQLGVLTIELIPVFFQAGTGTEVMALPFVRSNHGVILRDIDPADRVAVDDFFSGPVTREIFPAFLGAGQRDDDPVADVDQQRPDE